MYLRFCGNMNNRERMLIQNEEEQKHEEKNIDTHLIQLGVLF